MYDRPYMIKHTHNLNNIEKKNTGVRVMVMVFNATFNNISVLSCRSDLLVDETGVTGENQRPCRKSRTNFITYYCIEYTSSERDSNSQLQW